MIPGNRSEMIGSLFDAIATVRRDFAEIDDQSVQLRSCRRRVIFLAVLRVYNRVNRFFT